MDQGVGPENSAELVNEKDLLCAASLWGLVLWCIKPSCFQVVDDDDMIDRPFFFPPLLPFKRDLDV